MNPIIAIGLAGRKGSGKDTIADYLVANHGFDKLSFARPLKLSAAALLDIDAADFEVTKNDPKATVTTRYTLPGGRSIYRQQTVREFLQRYGTEAHRDIPEFGNSVWTNMLLTKLKPGGRYVIADSRFTNECRALYLEGGVVCYVERPSTDDLSDAHASEAKPDVQFFAEILNDGSLEKLYECGDELVAAVVERAQGRVGG